MGRKETENVTTQNTGNMYSHGRNAKGIKSYRFTITTVVALHCSCMCACMHVSMHVCMFSCHLPGFGS